jgi:hypothetical protein
VEDNTFTMADRVRAMMHRRYLTVSYLVGLWRPGTEDSSWEGRLPDEPVTFLGVEAPEGLREGSQAYTHLPVSGASMDPVATSET